MKKTISINIAGVVFHIEEDGYSQLKDYLASIQRYFSTYPDSSEIIADIESRIAERFLTKQQLDAKQAITLEDVNELMSAMGTVADFAASENSVYLDDEDDAWQSTTTTNQAPPTTNDASTTTESASQKPGAKPTTIYRDLRRKILGGVASGIAHRFSIDPLWVRLICIFLVTGFPILGGNFAFLSQLSTLSGIVILVYIAMWIAFPGSSTLEDDKEVKKFYRNPDKKVLGGVASGLASYFGVDTGVVRFLFIIGLLFFGGGLLLYIVLWAIAPAANTITEKMQMQGQPITLSGIENSLKKKITFDEEDSSSTATRLALLPFTIISAIVSFLEKALKGIGPIIRIIVGAVLTLTSAAGILALLIGTSVWVSLVDVIPFDSGIPSLLFGELSGIVVFSMLLFFVLPGVAFLLLGLTLLANRPLVKSSIWIVILGLWVMSIIGTIVSGSSFSRNFIRTSEYVSEDKFSITNGTLTLDQYKTNTSLPHDHVWVTLKGYDSDSVLIQRTAKAKGKSVEEARSNAQNIRYTIVQKDSTIVFDDRIHFEEGDKFRAQEINLVLMIPYEQPFIMHRAFFYDKIRFTNGNGANISNYNLEDSSLNFETLRWKLTRDQGIVCLNLPEQYLRSSTDASTSTTKEEGNYTQTILPEEAFHKVHVSNNFHVTIHQAPERKIQLKGTPEQIKEIKTEVKDNTLSISGNEDVLERLLSDNKTIVVDIYVPSIEELVFSGAVKTKIDNFTDIGKLKVTSVGACETDLTLQVDQLEVNVVGASSMTLQGKANSLSADITGASTLTTENMQIDNATISVVGISTANLGTIENLQTKMAGASKINTKK